MDINAKARLRVVKSLHTIIWAFFVGCILAIPVEALLRRFDRALLLIACVMLEVVTLALNSWHCPLSGVAARCTADRRANFRHLSSRIVGCPHKAHLRSAIRSGGDNERHLKVLARCAKLRRKVRDARADWWFTGTYPVLRDAQKVKSSAGVSGYENHYTLV